VRLIVQRYVGAADGLSDILELLEASLGPLSGTPTPLSGGITNRNYRVTLGGAEYVVRRPGKDTELLGIDRRAEHLANERAADLGIAPGVVTTLADSLVTRFIACRAVSADELAEGVPEIARSLRSFHDSALRLPVSFRVTDLLLAYSAIVRGRGHPLPAGYAETLSTAERIDVALGPAEPRPCHNDLLAGNLIRAQDDGRILIVDWEYAGMGDPRFDLGNLSVNNDFDEDADERLLLAYDGRRPSDARRAQLKLMRLLSDAREAAWGVVQAAVSELDFDFSAYAREHFERLLATAAEPCFEQWLKGAGGETGRQTA
jgi:thiamine kinase-like enzyme